ncbi:hypothetical protein HPB47_015621 [Ixodes persulcatus]|uniref:Uncharacterized protein n=1 Tax=Ixodes persulcatus TaxID=34615 RepID=A0AC60QSY7_IXOPE|nr:hypothetical protein HPB47_015621 [Ixodes persulcatus]
MRNEASRPRIRIARPASPEKSPPRQKRSWAGEAANRKKASNSDTGRRRVHRRRQLNRLAGSSPGWTATDATSQQINAVNVSPDYVTRARTDEERGPSAGPNDVPRALPAHEARKPLTSAAGVPDSNGGGTGGRRRQHRPTS